MPSYNIVTNDQSVKYLKQKTKYFKVDLGQSITLDAKSGEKSANTNDKFAYFYNRRYNTNIFSKGSIGNIKVYADSLIDDGVIAFYWDEDEYVFNIDKNLINEKGLDFFLGSILKQVHIKQDYKKEKLEKEKENKNKSFQVTEKIADPSKLFTNPGDVRYEDMLAYLDKQRQDRLRV